MHIEQLEAHLLSLDGKPAEVYDGCNHFTGKLIATMEDESYRAAYVQRMRIVCTLCAVSHPFTINFDASQVNHIAGNLITLRQSMVNG